jgi:hypothetical protein
MANWCDNTLELTTVARPDWVFAQLEWDCAMPFPFWEMYAFDKSIVSLVQGDDNLWILKLCFNSKWAPPEDFYRWLVQQEDTKFFYANYCEPGCQVLGEFKYENWVFIDNFVWIPDSFNSNILDLEIFIEEPHELYYEFYDPDSRATFDEYIILMFDYLKKHPDKANQIDAEIQECALLFEKNLEDQYYVELVSSLSD